MKNNKYKITKTPMIFLIVFLMFIMGNTAFSQTAYKVVGDSEISVFGTSTLHDWEMKTDKVEGAGNFEMDGTTINKISGLKISTLSEDLKSGKKGMDDKAYDALNTDKVKRISFSLREIENITFSNGENILEGTGDLEINRVVKTIPVDVKCKVDGLKITCEGEYAMKMTDFSVTPPTAILGTIKTGDDLTVIFNLSFAK